MSLGGEEEAERFFFLSCLLTRKPFPPKAIISSRFSSMAISCFLFIYSKTLTVLNSSLVYMFNASGYLLYFQITSLIRKSHRKFIESSREV